jgi:hypothetical protein
LIDPTSENEKIITIRLVEADLDYTLSKLALYTSATYSILGSIDLGCNSDYVEITDVAQNTTLLKVCGRDQLRLPESMTIFSVRGAVGVRFVSNMSMLHDVANKRKNHRGFKITYALSGKVHIFAYFSFKFSECGGNINLVEAHNRLAGTINSPGYPMPYHEDLECVWNVTAPKGYIIAVK